MKTKKRVEIMTIKTKTITKKVAKKKSPAKKAPTKKKTAKKKTTKRVSNKKIEDRYVVAELAFYCCDNNVFYNLEQLTKGLDKMTVDTFNFHVNNEKNDFYNWVRYVYKEIELAEKLLGINNKKEMKKIIKSLVK